MPLVRLAFALALLLLPLPLAAEPIALRYDIHAGGFFVGQVRVELDESEGGYRAATHFTSAGFIHFLTGLTMSAVASGGNDAQGPRSQAFRSDSRWLGEPRRVAVDYRGSAPAAVAIDPPAEADDRDPVAPALTAGTIDPLTAGLAVARFARDPAAAPPRLAGFDGRRRWDLEVARGPVEAVDEPFHKGLAATVSVTLHRVAGFARGGLFPTPPGPQTAKIWLAPPAAGTAGYPLPVRIQSDSPIGAVVIRLTAIGAGRRADGR